MKSCLIDEFIYFFFLFMKIIETKKKHTFHGKAY